MNTAISDLSSFFNIRNFNFSKNDDTPSNEEVSIYHHYTDTTVHKASDNNETPSNEEVSTTYPHYTDTTVHKSSNDNNETEDRLDIADYRNPKNIFEKISNFFKHIFAPAEYEIFEKTA